MKCEACNDRWFVYDENAGRYRCIDVAFCPMCGKLLTAALPLTLDELRERDGRPVWEDECGEWLIVDVGDDGEVFMWGVGGSICVFVEDDGEAQPNYFDHPPETSAE